MTTPTPQFAENETEAPSAQIDPTTTVSLVDRTPSPEQIAELEEADAAVDIFTDLARSKPIKWSDLPVTDRDLASGIAPHPRSQNIHVVLPKAANPLPPRSIARRCALSNRSPSLVIKKVGAPAPASITWVRRSSSCAPPPRLVRCACPGACPSGYLTKPAQLFRRREPNLAQLLVDLVALNHRRGP